MNNRYSYKDLVIRLDEHMESVDAHLEKIDKHLGKLNDRTNNCEVQVEKNKTRIGLIFKIGGGLVTVLAILASVAFGVMNLFD